MILGAGDPNTQHELANMIGTEKTMQRSISASFDEFNRFCGTSITASEQLDLIVQPHLLATINDVLLLSPYGLSRLEKFKSYEHVLLFSPHRKDVIDTSPVFNPIKKDNKSRKE